MFRPATRIGLLPLVFVLFGAAARSALAEELNDDRCDLVIANAMIIDGTGTPGVRGGVGVKDGRIVAVGDIGGRDAKETIDAQGQVLAPGFIDVHTHSEDICKIPMAENFPRMGVTTIITGNCGSSRTDVAGFFREIEKTGTLLNVATLVGHGSVRRQAMGGNFIRPPGAKELAEMERLVGQAMRDGAVGLSTGLIYVPGIFAKTEELIALAKVAAAHDGIYVSHMRHETVLIFEALDELARIAREANIRAQVSHLKLSGPSAWGRADEVLAVLDKARAEGLRITHDQYAYTASSTGLRQTIPEEALVGTREEYRARLADPEQKAAILAGMAAMREKQGRTDYAYAVIANFRDDPRLNGMSIPQAASLLGGDAGLAAQIELILDIEARGGASAVFHGMDEEDLVTFLRHPLTMVASDGGPRRLGEDVPHPRSYGNNARILARYVRELKVLGLEEAIRRMTSLPAETFGLTERGRIVPGAFADLVVFDPATVVDVAAFGDPHHHAEGFSHVVVNGGLVIRDGALTGTRSGGPLRKVPASGIEEGADSR